MRKLFILILALVAGAGTLFAEGGSCGQDGSTVKWDLTNGVLKITGTGEMADYSESNHAPWYSKRSKIESVQIMSAVTHIGSYAFLDCTNMTALNIGTGSKRTLGDGAFKNCTKLEEVNIPTTVSVISVAAFRGCSALASVHLPEGLYSIENRAFAGCTSLASITIPSTVKSINLYAFSQTIALKTVYFNARACNDFTGTTSLGSDHVFPALISLTFGDAVEYVPAEICMYSEYLKSVTFGKNIRKIGEKAFDHCNKLESAIILPDKLDTISKYAFAYSKITSVTFGKNIKYIGQQAFYGCTGLTSLVLTGNVYVFDHAFADSYNIKSVTIGEDVDYLDSHAFEHCPLQSVVWNVKNYTRSVSGTASPFKPTSGYITSFVFGENVERIPAELLGCTSFQTLTSITIPESVQYIGKDAFKSCSSLNSVVWNARACGENTYSDSAPFYAIRQQITSFVIGDKVTFIPSYLCYEMNKLPKVDIPASVTSIGNHAFDGCSKWAGQNIVIPNDVMTLGDYAFANCNLATITIGSKVNSIGKYAFMGSDNVTAVYNEAATPQSITANVFGDLNLSACDLYVPEASIPAYKAANVWKNFRSFNPTCLQGSGTTGNLKWTLSCSGHLSISGTGAMPDYTRVESVPTAPWRSGGAVQDHTILSAEVSDGITNIGDNAFYNCRDMAQVYIPNSVTKIGESSFYGCQILEAVTLSDNITSIGWNAFNQCSALKSITLPVHLKSIEGQAFFMCSGLTSLEIPNEVTEIGEDAFGYCTGLLAVTIPASVTSIGARAFAGDTKLEAIRNDAMTPQAINANVFGSLDKSKCKLIVPKNALAAYLNAPVWKEFDIQTDEGILASGTCGAQGDNLTWTLTTDGVLTIVGTGEMEAFNQAPWYTWRNSILSVVIENGATTISPVAFMSCNFLSHVEIPSTVTTIGDGAFTSCYALSEIAIPNSVKSLGNYTFLQCSSISSITIPEGVTTIGGLTFSQCVSLTDVKLPSTIKSLDASAFSKCASLTTITLPASLTTIGVSAFAECYALESVTNEAVTPQTINPNVFDNLTLSNICLYVPESAVSTYKNTAVWKDFSPIVPIGTIPTAIDQANSQELKAKSQKLIRDGQLLIERDGKVYTVTGQRVQ